MKIMRKLWKEFKFIIKKMIQMIDNPFTKWMVILWLCMYMTYIFTIFGIT